jgi:cytochrome c biogenesis protein ResB
MLLVHAGCILILAGGGWGSKIGFQIRDKLPGADIIPKGQMVIYEGQTTNLVSLENSQDTKELPFSIKLKDFKMEYYPIKLLIQTRDGRSWKVPVEFGKQVSLGDDLGTITVVKSFENFKIGIEGGKNVPVDDPRPGSNPALEVLVTLPDGQMTTKYIFELFPGHSSAEDKFLMSYRRMPSDYISELQVIRDGKVVGEKDIEVNHPLHYGGYHFYQSSYDAKAGQFTVLQVVSDSGLYIVYAGYWALCLGVIWHLWLRHVFSKIRTKKQANGN